MISLDVSIITAVTRPNVGNTNEFEAEVSGHITW
jgi:hypothetical protein